MKIAIIQKDINNNDYLEYLNSIDENNTDLVLMGELATSGCLYNGGEVEDFEKVLNSLSKYKFDICIGIPRKSKGKLFNSYVYYHKGEYQIYNKINLFEPMNEVSVYQKGDKPGIFETGFGKFGAAICYDIRFPEIFENLSKQDVKMIFIPAAFPRIRIKDWRQLLIERAKETKAVVIGINVVGDDGTYEFGGSSMVVSSDGQIIAQADEVNETIIEVEL